MASLIRIHPENPQPRLVNQVVERLRAGEVIVYPTDSCYALGCHIGDKSAQDRIRRIRGLTEKHDFTLVCRDLSEIGLYSKVDNSAYRLIKSLTPGPYTFLLRATHEVPRRLQNPRRKTIGLRVPDNKIARAILETLGEPIMSSTLLLPGDDVPMTDPDDMHERLQYQVNAVVDGGHCGLEPTTVIDLVEGAPVVVRRGKGAVAIFED